MFFSYYILVRKNSNFSLVWRFMHDRKKVQRKELLNFDVVAACDDLRGYIPTGSLSVSELQNKMSLYLLSQLVYGISLVHQYKTLALNQFANEVVRGLLYAKEEPTKRKNVDVEDEFEQRGLNEETPAPKRKRVSKRASSVLDLNDPSSYVAERPIRHSNTMEPLFGADDMFQVPELPEMGLEPAEEFMKMQQEVSDFRSQEIKIEQEMAIDTSLKEMKVSVGRYDDWPALSQDEGIEEVRARTMSSITSAQEALKTSALFDDSTHQPPVTPPMLSPPRGDGPENVPVYRQQVDSLASQEEFMLEPLPDVVKPADGKRKKRRLLVDNVTILTSDQITEQMKAYSDTLRSEDENLVANKLGVEKLPINTLFNPRPWHIQHLNEALFPLFDSVLQQPKPVISFDEANKYGVEELRRRYWDAIGFDIQSWTSENVNEIGAAGDAPAIRASQEFAEMQPQEVSDFRMQDPNIEQEMEVDTNLKDMKVSVGRYDDWPALNQDDEIENIRARTLSSHFSALEEPKKSVLFEDSNLQPQMSPPIMSPARAECPEYVPGTTDLYKELADLAGTGICNFSDVVPRNTTKHVAAKKFYDLLCLLKRKDIKVKQTEPFGNILVRLAP